MAPNPAAPQSNPTMWRGYLTHAAFVTTVAVAIFGCIPIPIHKSEPLPDIGPHIPAEVRADARPVLVLVQGSGETETETLPTFLISKIGGEQTSAPPATIQAKFVRGIDLTMLGEEIKVEAEEGVALSALICGGLGPCGVVPMAWSSSAQKLQKLCVVTPSGRLVSFTSTYRREMLHSNRRDAIVSALRTGDKAPFEKVDGPCGIRGEVEWKPETRTQVIEYLNQLPSIEPITENPDLARVIQRAKTSARDAEPQSGMLMVTMSWDTQKIVQLLYLSAEDIHIFNNLMRPTTASNLIALLPFYSSGARALENISVDLICAIESNGEAAWWSTAENIWKPERMISLEYRKIVLSALKEGSHRYVPLAGCTPRDTSGWSDSQLREAIAFLERLPLPSSSERLAMETALHSMAESRATGDPATAAALLLVVTIRKDNVEAHPFFLSRDQDIDAFVRMILLQPGEFVTALRKHGLHDTSAVLDEVCVVTTDGRLIELVVGWWDEPRYSHASPEFKKEALKALRGRSSDYRGCKFALEKTERSRQLRSNVATFLNHVNVGAVDTRLAP